MKKLKLFVSFLFFSLFFFSSRSANAQVLLWGMTNAGGQNGLGTIFNLDGSGTIETVEHSFTQSEGTTPLFTSLIRANGYMLYGMSYKGGVNDMGTLFQFDPGNNTYIKKLDFDSINGKKPLGSLLQTNDGMLYGMTYKGGTYDKGVLFKYDPGNSIYTKKMDFDGTTTGCYPHGSLMQASDGKLYGLTVQGGANDKGVLFQFDPVTSVFTKKIDLDSTNGCNPLGALMQANDGMLYGLTCNGGADNMGVLFQYDPVNNTYINKFNFTGPTTGGNPLGFLIQATDGKLYGMTNVGGANNFGVLFQYNLASFNYTNKFDFDSINGSYPYGSLMQSFYGKIYGMTELGGTSDLGVLFEYDPVTSSLVKKIDFNGANGANPYGTLTETILEGVPDYSKNDGQISIYPNPNNGDFALRSTSDGNYSIVNALGQIIQTLKLNASNDYSMTVKNLNNGIYFIVGFNDGHLSKQKVVVAK